jgi:hypothetical protein
LPWIEVFNHERKCLINIAVYSTRSNMMRAIESDRKKYNLTNKPRKPCVAMCRTFNGYRNGKRGWLITVIYLNRPDYKSYPGTHVHEITHALQQQKRRLGSNENNALLAERLYCLIHDWGRRGFGSFPNKWDGWPSAH